MLKAITLVRDPNKNIPDDWLAKAMKEYPNAMGLAVAHVDGTQIVVRHNKTGKFSFKDMKDLLSHDGLKNRQVFVSLVQNSDVMLDDDIPPYPILYNEEKQPIVVAFLNGDFSLFEETGNVHSNEFFCVSKELVPRVAKLWKLTKEDLEATMEELKDEVTAKDWANFMLGDSGSITLLAANGDSHTILVAGEDRTQMNDGWWTSDHMGVVEEKEEAPKSFADDFTTALGAIPAVGGTSDAGQQAQPKRRVIPARPIASTDPVNPTPRPDVQPDEGDQHPPDKQQPDDQRVVTVPPELGDPDAKLSINIPPGMDEKRTVKWLGKRLHPDAMPRTIKGLKKVTVKRSEANAAFIQTYLEQNKLGGLEVLKGDIPPKSQGTGRIIPAARKAGEYPETTSSVPEVPQKDTEPHHVGSEQSDVVAEPLPVFSDRQREELVNFINSRKDAIDRHGKEIADPSGLEKVEKRVKSFADQFGGVINLTTMATLDLDSWLTYAKHDYMAVAKAGFLLGMENIKLQRMIDEFTDPHTNKPSEEEKEQPEVQQTQPQQRRIIKRAAAG